MKKVHFLKYGRAAGWPSLQDIRPLFIAPAGHEWYAETGNDSGNLRLQGVDGTDEEDFSKGRRDINLLLWGRPGLGVLLIYELAGGGGLQTWVSKGDQSRIGEYIRSTHDTPLPIAYFVPFADAWNTVKEFMQSEGVRPRSIEWVASRDLPPNTFPDP